MSNREQLNRKLLLLIEEYGADVVSEELDDILEEEDDDGEPSDDDLDL